MQASLQKLSVSSAGAPARGAQRRRGNVRPFFVLAASGNGNGASVTENVVVIGSGPAGYTAAIYAGRANLKPLVFEGVKKGGVPGGQLMGTTEVENFPGFPEGILGPDLMDRMREQALRCGADLHTEDVESVDLSQRPFVVRTSEREVRANSIILATGATARRLGLPRESEFWSRGISACAICDGAAPIFRGQHIGVIGGGDSATEEAVYLTKYAKHVHLVVRGPKMRASAAMQDRVRENAMITVHYNSEPLDVTSDSAGQMNGLKVRDAQSGAESVIPLRGVFYGIGHTPNSDIVKGQIDLDQSGFVRVTHGAQTSVEGVFSAGDLHDTEWRQAITAAGSGCMAAISAERFLSAQGLIIEFAKKEAAPAAAAAHAAEAARAHSGAESSSSSSSSDPKQAAAAVDLSLTAHKGSVALRKLYHESQRPIMVVYTAPTCGPCRRLKPMLAGVVDEYGAALHFVEIDIEADPEIAEAAGVNGTPAVHIFNKKERLAVMNGVKMKSEYRTVLDAALGRQPAAA